MGVTCCSCCCNCPRCDLEALVGKLPERQRQRIREREGLETWVHDLLMVSAETGNIEILEAMAEAHLWQPSTCNDVVWAAGQVETLLELLQHFQVPLGSSPNMDLHLDKALEVLCREEQDEDSPAEGPRSRSCTATTGAELRSARKVGKAANGIIKPMPQAMLLANLMMVPNDMAKQAMDGILENMIVFQPETYCKTKIIPDGYRSPLQKVTRISIERLKAWQVTRNVEEVSLPKSVPKKQLNFPDALGAIFLHRKAVSESASFNKEERELRDWPNDGDVTPTSPKFVLEAEESACLATFMGVPLGAVEFAYFFVDPGGFVYLDKEGQILAVTAIAFDFRGCALSFGSPVPLSKEACDMLEQDKRWSDVTVKPLRDKGAKQYTFVGPGDKLGKDFEVEDKGGFCYQFDNDHKPCYFPIISAGEVMYRAAVHQSSPNAAMLPTRADGRDVQKIVYPKHRCPCGKRKRKELVKFARLPVPGILHPVVLRSLVNTPWPPVLSTIAAQALTQTAFDEHVYEIVFDVIEEVLSLLAITGITLQVRRDDIVGLSGAPLTLMHCELVVIALVSVKNFSDEICKFLGCFYQGWASDYAGRGTLLDWVGLIGMLSSFAWIEAGLFYGFAPTFHLRALLAVNGAINWIRVLYAFRGTIVFSLGPRILPILSALCDVTDFVLIMMFFMGAGAHVFFALSDYSSSWGSILFSTYKLGLLAEFEIPDDVFFVSEDEEYFSWSSFQYAAFIIFSFVVSISLTNIFIGVMSNSFDHHSDRVDELLKRTRASIALDYTLRDGGRKMLLHRLCGHSLEGLQSLWTSRGNRLWFCYRRLEEGQETAENGTLRGSIHASRDAIAKRLHAVEGMCQDISGKLEHRHETCNKRRGQTSWMATPGGEPREAEESGEPKTQMRGSEVSQGDQILKYMADFRRLEGEVRQVRELQESEASQGKEILKRLEDLDQKARSAEAMWRSLEDVLGELRRLQTAEPRVSEVLEASPKQLEAALPVYYSCSQGLSGSSSGSDAGDGEGSLPPLPTVPEPPQEEALALPAQAVHSIKGASCHDVFPSTPTPTPVMLGPKGASYHDVFGKPDPSPPAPKRVVKKAKRRRSRKYDED